MTHGNAVMGSPETSRCVRKWSELCIAFFVQTFVIFAVLVSSGLAQQPAPAPAPGTVQAPGVPTTLPAPILSLPGVPGSPVPTSPEAIVPGAPQTQQGETETQEKPLSLVPGATRVEQEELSPIENLLVGRVPDIDEPLRQFGYSLFRAVPTTFAPVTDVPVGPDYVIGPDDSLNIVLWGGVQATYPVTVDRNGAIEVPRLGVVQVGGLTLDQLQVFLRQRFTAFYPSFEMAVTLGKLRTIRVFVVGEVGQPGAYTVSSLSTIINALFASGGPTKNGSLRRIRLVRQGRTVRTLDLYDFLLRGDKSRDQTLQSGDTIFVPVIGPVAGVAGNVKRPGIYEVETADTLQKLLGIAGGVTPLGYLQRVQVERIIASEKKIVLDLDLSATLKKPESVRLGQTRLADGDLVRIFAIATGVENVVTLEGHALRPGRYELKPGMRVHDLIPSYEALLPDPFGEYGEIIRLVGAARRSLVVRFKLDAMLAGDAEQNILLQPQDIVRVFSRSQFVDARQVRISGLVQQPGIYPLTQDMRVKDLILRAHNVLKFAYLDNAELTRRHLEQSGEVAMRVEIDLKKALAEDPEHNLLLEDFDHLVVRQLPDIELQRDVQITEAETEVVKIYPLLESDVNATEALKRAASFTERTVDIRGEVFFPGTYPIMKGERLSSVIRRAGGFTSVAYLRGAVLTRQSVKLAQEERLQTLIREEEASLLAESAAGAATALSAEEAATSKQATAFRSDLLARLRTVKPDGRLVVRLRPLDIFAGSDDDLLIERGDRLVIPETPQYINVLGSVFNRASLPYEPNKDIAQYLQEVGGLRPEALEKEIYLVQLDGTVISNSQSQFAVVLASGETMRFRDFFTVRPQPGDTIVVPRRTTEPATLRNLRDIVQIVFQGVSSLAVILTVF